MNNEEFEKIAQRVETGETITYEELREYVTYIEDVGIDKYRGMSAHDWVASIRDALDATKG